MTKTTWRAAAAAAALTSIAGTAPAQEVQRGGTLVVGVSSEQRILNPALRASTGVYVFTGKIMEPLIDKTYEGYRPVLATGWEGSDDGLTVTLELREGVSWHDGEAFTCEDVAFSAENMWRELLNYGSTLHQHLDRVECPDDHTAVFHYNEPMPIELFLAAAPDLGHPAPAHLFEGTDILQNPVNTAPVGTGPFIFRQYERGQFVMAERNPDWWGAGEEDYPYLDRIVWQFIKDPSAAAAAVEAGQVLQFGFNGLSMADLVRLADDPRFTVGNEGYENNVAHSTVEFNHRNPILADVRVRQAIAHALDREFAIETIMRGFAKPGVGPVPSSGGVNFTDDVPTYEYDPAKAEAMLDEAGYPRGDDGTRFSLKLRSAPWGEYTKLWGDFIAQSLGEVGIEVEQVANDAAGFLSGVYRDHDFDLANGWHQFRADPAVSTTVWLRSGAPVGTPWSNQFGFIDEEMDQLIDAAASETDPDLRASMYHDLQRHVQETLPVYFAIEHPFVSITNNRLHNHHNTPRWKSSSWYDLWMEQ